MRTFGKLGAAVSVGLLAMLALGSPAYALTVISQSGKTGDFGSNPHSDNSEGKCGYLPDAVIGFDLQYITAYAPSVGPAGNKTSQKVSWHVILQSEPKGGGSWTKVKTSASQTGTATNSSSPAFTAIKVPLHFNANLVYRAVVEVDWLTAGAVSGTVKFAPDIYALKNGKVNETIQFEGYCYGTFTG